MTSKKKSVILDLSTDLQSYALPSGNFSIDFCYTIPKEILNDVKSVEIDYLADLNLYLHLPGQFFFTWHNDLNMVRTSSLLNVKRYNPTEIIIYDLKVNFILEKHIGLKRGGLLDFDSCVLNLKVDAQDTLGKFIKKSDDNGNWGKYSITKENFKNVSLALSSLNRKCSLPNTLIRTKSFPSILTKRSTLSAHHSSRHRVFNNEIQWKEKQRKPKVILNIPAFTKIEKVIVCYEIFLV